MRIALVAGEAWAVWVLAAGLFLLPLFAIVLPLAIATLGVVLGLALVPFVLASGAWRRLPPLLLLLPAGLAVWGLASAPWAVEPGRAATTSLRFMFIVLLGSTWIGAAIGTGGRAEVRFALAAGFWLALAMLLVDMLAGHPLAGLLGLDQSFFAKRAASVAALLVWPVHALVRRRLHGPWPYAATAGAMAVILLGDSVAAGLALVLGTMAAALVWLLPRRGPMLLAVGVVVAVLAMPVAAYHLPSPHRMFQDWQGISNSVHHRLTIWGFVADRIVEKPLTGWGMDASRRIPGGDYEVIVRRLDGTAWPSEELSEALLPLHPHNAVLQIWLELGLTGALLFSAFLVWLFRCIMAGDPGGRALFSALAVSGVGISMLSYGMLQGWWQASLWLSAVAMLTATARPEMKEDVT